MQTLDRSDVRRVLVVTLALNLVVAAGKIIVGLFSGALAISADGVHSLIDGSSNIVALIANRIADKPPDAQHPYGHTRFETLAALGIGLLLILTAWEIVGGALERLRTPEPPDVTPLTIGVLVATLLVNLFVSRYERREGERLRSELLLADAANTGADVFVTLSVLVSTVVVAFTGWWWVDPLAALVIVALIVRAAFKVLRQTGSVLVDTAPYSAAELTALIETLPAVEGVSRARSRGTPAAAHIDIDVQVAPETTAEHTAAIAVAIREALEHNLTGISEVEVHFIPRAGTEPNYALAARARADALDLLTHEVRLSETRDGSILELHVEVPPGQTLADAHAQVTTLENSLRASLPDLADVITHIEPAISPTDTQADSATLKAADSLQTRACALLREHYPGEDWHHFRVTPLDSGYALTMHVTLPSETTVEDAHNLAESAELLLRSRLPEIQRATIHTEPPGD